jgi:Uma2 family endonuclease
MSAAAAPAGAGPQRAPVSPPIPLPHPSGLPAQVFTAGLRRFTTDEYHALIRAGVLTEKERTVLIEGCVVHKMVVNPPHSAALNRARKLLDRLLPRGWDSIIQSPVTLPTSGSEPEPDYAIVRESADDYATRHPGPADIGLVVEVADSSLAVDRTDSQRIYARAGIAVYWIVNIPDRQIEVYTDPQPATNPPAYATRRTYSATDAVPVILDGLTIGTVAVADVLP